MSKLGIEPAFPFYNENYGNGYPEPGMSKRLLLAKDLMCAILQNDSLLSAKSEFFRMPENDDRVVKRVYNLVDKLLEQE